MKKIILPLLVAVFLTTACNNQKLGSSDVKKESDAAASSTGTAGKPEDGRAIATVETTPVQLQDTLFTYFSIAPETLFDQTTNGITTEEKDTLVRKGESSAWKIDTHNREQIRISCKYPTSEISLSLLRRPGKPPLMLAYTMNEQNNSFMTWEETRKGVLKGTKLEFPELEINDFFTEDNKLRDLSSRDFTYPDYYINEQNTIEAYLYRGYELAEKADYNISLQWNGAKFNLVKTIILKYRLKVSLYGTESNAKKRLQQFIGQYEKKHRVKIPFERSSWGEEGEESYCFRLKGFNVQQQRLFVAEVKKLLKGSMAHIKEYAACPNR